MSIANRTYRDIAFSFFANPMSGDMGKKTGASAVKQSIVAILKTNYNERLFDPEFGTDIRGSLFEQMNPITEQRMRKKI
jgi:phage baseplate assembly protein W